jgi:hypothetical protein
MVGVVVLLLSSDVSEEATKSEILADKVNTTYEFL